MGRNMGSTSETTDSCSVKCTRAPRRMKPGSDWSKQVDSHPLSGGNIALLESGSSLDVMAVAVVVVVVVVVVIDIV